MDRIKAAALRVLSHSSPFKNRDGEVHYAFKDVEELCDEEDNDNYLPKGVETVLEIQTVAAKVQGKGHGTRLMDAFMNQAFVKKADAIYLDPSPLLESLDGKKVEGDEEEILDKLERFYTRWGFRNRHIHSRMWIFNKIKVRPSKYPT